MLSTKPFGLLIRSYWTPAMVMRGLLVVPVLSKLAGADCLACCVSKEVPPAVGVVPLSVMNAI